MHLEIREGMHVSKPPIILNIISQYSAPEMFADIERTLADMHPVGIPQVPRYLAQTACCRQVHDPAMRQSGRRKAAWIAEINAPLPIIARIIRIT